jgi:MFS family permease
LVEDATSEPDSPSRAWLFLPFGLAPAMVLGYVMIAVSDALSRAGIPLSSVCVLVTAAFLPAILMFLWAPLIDTVGSRQRWILVGVLLLCAAAVGLAASGGVLAASSHLSPSGTARSLAMAAGALLGARLWLRLGTKPGCVLSSFALAAFALLVLAIPRTPQGFAVVVCGCGLLSGAALSALAGLILETVEDRASSTQASVLVATGNLGNVYLPPMLKRKRQPPRGGWRRIERARGPRQPRLLGLRDLDRYRLPRDERILGEEPRHRRVDGSLPVVHHLLGDDV